MHRGSFSLTIWSGGAVLQQVRECRRPAAEARTEARPAERDFLLLINYFKWTVIVLM